ncbi:MAG: helix-turn-helix transcriptional regulator [Phycisphaeraceae bacterium]|nr:helix-turn-helix transcriptional regulator [Phycisphaeraceae bacterium]
MRPDPLEPVFKALASPWRRTILDLLRDGPLSTGDLDAALPELSRFGVMQHLSVLEEANLIVARKEGRTRMNHLNAVPLRRVYERWVSRFEGHWAGALISLKDSLEAQDTPGDERRPPARPKTDTTDEAAPPVKGGRRRIDRGAGGNGGGASRARPGRSRDG